MQYVQTPCSLSTTRAVSERMARLGGGADVTPVVETTGELLETLRWLDIVVTDFMEESQPGLDKNLNDLVSKLQSLDNMKNKYKDVQIPLDVLSYIDDGLSPGLCTRDCLEETKARNEAVKGKIDSISRFRELLEMEVDRYFPEEVERFRELRAAPNQQTAMQTCAGADAPVNINVNNDGLAEK